MIHALPCLVGLCLTLPTDPRDPKETAIVGARLIDGTGAAPRDGCTVLLRGDRIAGVGPGVAVPAGAEVVQARGRTLIPGMFDTHGHCFAGDGEKEYEAYPLLFLAGGVTSVFSPGEVDPEGAFALRERLRNGEQVGARLFSGGPYFELGQGEVKWLKGFDTLEQGLELLAKYGPRMDGLKLQTNLTEDQVGAIIAAAHKLGLKCTGHLGATTATRAIELGIDRLEHGLVAMGEFAPYQIRGMQDWADKFATLGRLDLRSPPVQKLVDLIVTRRVALSATTAAYEMYAPDYEPVTPDWEKYLAPPTARMEKAMALRRSKLPPEQGKAFAAGVQKQLEFLKLVHDRGGILVTGTDPGAKNLIPGFGVHRELRLLVRAGLTPLAAIRAATQHAAWSLGVDRDLGTIEAGKVADVVLVDGDPSTQIADVGRTFAVWQAGRRHDPVELRKQAEGRIR